MLSSMLSEPGMRRTRATTTTTLWLLLCSLVAVATHASVVVAPYSSTKAYHRSLASSSSFATVTASDMPLDYYSIPAFSMVFQSSTISQYTYLVVDEVSTELQNIMNAYFYTFLKKSHFDPPLPSPITLLQAFHLQVTFLEIVPWTVAIPGSTRSRNLLRNRQRQLQPPPPQQQQQQQQGTTNEDQIVLLAKFHGNVSLDASSQQGLSYSSNQTAIRLIHSMLNHVMELATTRVQVQLLQQEIVHVMSNDPILQGCTNITFLLDIDHVVANEEAAAAAAEVKTSSSNSDDRNDTVTTIHALIITLVLFCTAVFVTFLYVLARRHSNHGRRSIILHPHNFMGGGGSDEMYDHSNGTGTAATSPRSFRDSPSKGGGGGGNVELSSSSSSTAPQHHSPEVFKILEDSDRYLSKHRPDLFRALQSTHNLDDDGGSRWSSFQVPSIPNPLESISSFFKNRASSSSNTSTSTTTLLRPSPISRATSRQRSATYNRRRSLSNVDPESTRIILSSGSTDERDHRNHHRGAPGGGGIDPSSKTVNHASAAMAASAMDSDAAAAAAAAESSRSWDGTGFTPISTWVRWATGGGWTSTTSGDSFHQDRSRGEKHQGTFPLPPPPAPFLVDVNLNDDDDDDDDEVYNKNKNGRDGVFRYDIDEEEDDPASNLACDEDPKNYPFVYRDFPRHDGTPCLIFEIGDDDDDNNVAAGGAAAAPSGMGAKEDGDEERDMFGSWKTLLRRNTLSKPELMAYFSSSSSNNLNVANSNNNSADNNNNNNNKALPPPPPPVHLNMSNIHLMSDEDLKRLLEQHAMDQYMSRSQKGNLPTDPESEEEFKRHLEQLLASRFRHVEKRSILERHRELRQKERDEAAAAIARSRSQQSEEYDDDDDDDDGEQYGYEEYDKNTNKNKSINESSSYDDDDNDDDDDDDEDEEEQWNDVTPLNNRRMNPRRASQRQLDMERDIAALEESISPRSGRVPRKICSLPPVRTTTASTGTGAAATTTATNSTASNNAYNPWSSTSSFHSTVYVPPPPPVATQYVPAAAPPPPAVVASQYTPPPPPPIMQPSNYTPPQPLPLSFDENKPITVVPGARRIQSLGSNNRSNTHNGISNGHRSNNNNNNSNHNHRKSTTSSESDLVEYALDFRGITPPKEIEQLQSGTSTFDLTRLRNAFKDCNAPSMDELFGARNRIDIAELRAAFAESNAPSMDELRQVTSSGDDDQEPLEEFLQKGLLALESSSSARSSSSSIVANDNNSNNNNAIPHIPLLDDDQDVPPAPSSSQNQRFSSPLNGRRRRKMKHQRSFSDTNSYDWDMQPIRSSSTHSTHRSENGDIAHHHHPQQHQQQQQQQQNHYQQPNHHKQHRRTSSFTEEAMLRGDIAHPQHKRTPSYTEDVMVHGIYAQIRHDKFMFETNNDEKTMH